MADITKNYEAWLTNATADPDLIPELAGVKDNAADIEDRFYRELEFGTAGLRGVIGAGTNRMNYYTIARATQGLSDYINAHGKNKSVAIAYDSRIKSEYFARSAAAVFAANGIKAYIYETLIPVPMLSYAVRALQTDAGCVVTASHNPAKYNGYKAYGPDGCQMTDEAAGEVLDNINRTDYWNGIKTTDFDVALASGQIEFVPESVHEGYYAAVKACSLHSDIVASAGLKVVYTPLNGAGNLPVRRILGDIGVTDIVVVPEQELPDGNFPTCSYPNPEIRETLNLGMALCDKVKPDLLLATDPDCDRVGIAVPDGEGGYALFSGNETGALLLEYIAKERTATGRLPKNPVAVKSFVSTSIADEIAKKYGVEMRSTLTGFKWIGDQIAKLEADGEAERFIFGFEESYGYLGGTYARDKDAVIGSMLICEMAAFYRSQGISMIEARKRLYEEYGYYNNTQDNIGFEGASGMKKMGEIMDKLRSDPPAEVAGRKVTAMSDYGNKVHVDFVTGGKTELPLPKSNVLQFFFDGGMNVIVRPSGTEPKIKIYYTTIGKTAAEADAIRAEIGAVMRTVVA